MKSLVLILGQKKRVVFLGILMMVNVALFSLPGFPANIAKVIGKNPDTQIPDMQLGYTVDEVYDFLTFIGPEARQAYQLMHLTTDFAFPIVYGVFLFSIISYLLVQARLQQFLITLSGILASGFDLAENFTLMYITDRFPDFLPGLANLARIFTMAKFSFMFISFIIIGFLFVKNLRRPS